ncbi:autotransporter outer membrane beta-barrel domain-containing protein [Variovorax sp. OV329]|uniref:autotransporter family protein n=1 Tax=Variovorax sp. OV329 TaxID=1882825 RepID=UPI0020C88F6A|nr:autotransporter outer membrane beta-barrel domain-containing protein [Variovorax sp. OV329]
MGRDGGSAILNIGAAAGNAAVAPGSVIASAVAGGATGTAVVNFNHNASAYDFAAPITGSTGVNHVGSGTTTLLGASTYAGATNVAGGTLRAGAASVLSSVSAHTVAAGGTLDLNGFEQTLSSLSNAGTVSLPGSTAGNTLTVTGAYVGNGGTLRLGTALGDSSSASDRLVLSGPSASATGRTNVQIANLGGLGAQTSGNGIEVVSATGGATTTAQSTKDAFSLAGGHVDAGAYEYRLYAADASGAGENWYLRSTAIPVVTSPAEEPGSTPSPVPLYRAEVPMYAVVPQQFRELDIAMLGNLHQRVGDERVASSGSAWGNRQGWGRILSVDRDIAQQGTVSPTSSGRLTGFQAGTDLWANPNWRTGLYAGQLEGDMDVNGFARGVVNYAAGRNDLRSQYFGAYATWSQPSGLYVDNVLQAGRHRYTAYPSQGQASSGKGDSIVASIEVGQGFAIAPRWTLEPQLQLAYQHLGLDDTSISGASIQQDTDNGWIARAGLRIKGQLEAGPGALQPYARVNFYKRSSGTDITRFIGPAGSADIASRTGGTSSELAFGATWQLGQRTSLYGELGKLWDLSGDARTSSSVSGSVGVKVLW